MRPALVAPHRLCGGPGGATQPARRLRAGVTGTACRRAGAGIPSPACLRAAFPSRHRNAHLARSLAWGDRGDDDEEVVTLARPATMRPDARCVAPEMRRAGRATPRPA